MDIYTRVNDSALFKLNDTALLAFLLTAEKSRYFSLQKAVAVLQECGNSINRLSNLKTNEIASLSYLGYADAVKLKAILEFSNRSRIQEVLDKPKITKSNDIYQLFEHLSTQPYEEFWIIILNRANMLIDRVRISEGGIAGTVVDQRKIFKHVIDAYGTGLILVHNHPSGNIIPSDADKKVTNKIVGAAELFDVKVLDHIIIGKNQYYSFSDYGFL